MKITTLVNTVVSVERGREAVGAEMVPNWTLVLVDKDTGDQIRFGFQEEVRDFIVKGLMSGILIASNGG